MAQQDVSNTATSGGDPAGTAVLEIQRGDVIVARMERLPFTRKHWAIAVLLSTGTFFDAFDSLIIGAILVVIVTSLQIPIQAAGILVGAAFAGQLIGALVAGVLSELVGRRLVLLGTLLIFSSMALVCAFAQDLNQLYIARVIQGFGLGAEVPIAGALFNEFVRGRTRGLVVGLYENAFNLAVNIAPLIALVVYALFGNDPGWRVLFAIGALPLLSVFARRSILPESPRWLIQKNRTDEAEQVVAAFEASARGRGQPLPEPLVKPLVRPGRTNFLEIFDRTYRQRTAQVWVQWFSFFMIPQFDRWGRRPVFVAGFAAAAIALLTGAFVVGVMGITDWYVLAIITTIVSMGSLTSSLGLYMYTPELYPTRMRAWGTAAATSMNRLAQTVGPALAGILIGSAFGIAAVFAVNGVLAIVGAVTVFWFGIETRGPDTRGDCRVKGVCR